MIQINFLIAALAALFPLAFGMVWYNPKVFGKAWMVGAGLSEDDAKAKMNMPLVFGLTFFYSFLIAMSLHFMTIHQFGLQSLILPEAGSTIPDASYEAGKQLLSDFSHSYRSFKHGALHGTISSIFFVLPIIAINGLFEFRGWKYIAINAGYWVVCCAVMGGIVCQFA